MSDKLTAAEKAYQRLIGGTPAKAMVQRLHDLKILRKDLQRYNEPLVAAADIQAYAQPRPTLYNATTGEWSEVLPEEARLRGAPIGRPLPTSKRFQGGYGGEQVLYGSALMRV